MEIRKFEFMAKTQFLCTRIRTIDIDQRKFKQTLCYEQWTRSGCFSDNIGLGNRW